jgi:hypothetical protein
VLERRRKKSLHPTLAFRELLLAAAAATLGARESKVRGNYAMWFGLHFPPQQTADWDTFVWRCVNRGEATVLRLLLERFYNPTSPDSIGCTLQLSRRAGLSRRPKAEGRRRDAYDIVHKYLRAHPTTAAILAARPELHASLDASWEEYATEPPPDMDN